MSSRIDQDLLSRKHFEVLENEEKPMKAQNIQSFTVQIILGLLRRK